MCKRVRPCEHACLYVFKDVYLVSLPAGRLVSVHTQVWACAHTWEYGEGVGVGSGLTPPGGVQVQALSLEDSMVQYKEPWTELEAGR